MISNVLFLCIFFIFGVFAGSIEFEELNMSGLTTVNNQTPDSSEKATNGDKPSKKEGNLEPGGQKPKESKTSRRTTSLLNLFMSSSQGMCS